MAKHSLATLMGSAMLLVLGCGAAAPGIADERIPVKVMIISMFSLEGAPWLAALKPAREVRVPNGALYGVRRVSDDHRHGPRQCRSFNDGGHL
jgi:purine nucleoside permease